ncbi:hypothetical protein GGR51DRAFT_529623 [Nemania sp. FL0031]|nr:hypothetical protein GGR51DRAFT_529623 [Nemania sp. FL0031]
MIGLLLPLILISSSVFAQDSTCGFSGGWPVRKASGCNSDAPVSCGLGLQPRCCPSGFECLVVPSFDGTSLAYCCPPGQDCAAETNDHPQCPVSSWNAWAYNSDGTRGWCCEEGYYGFATLAEDGVGCQPIGRDIDTESYETATQFFAQSLACASSSATTVATTVATTTTSSLSVLSPWPSTTSTVASSYSTTLSGLPSTTTVPSNSTTHSTPTSSTTPTSTNASTTSPLQGIGSNMTPAGVASLAFAAVAGSLLLTIL